MEIDFKEFEEVLKGKVLVLNAPPGAGKDTIADRIAEITGCARGQFKEYLYFLTAALFVVDIVEFKKVAMDREAKEVKMPELNNLSPREALIYTSEACVKPHFGKDYFGRVESRRATQEIETGIAYSDCGFTEELDCLTEAVGAENVFLVKFTRKGSESFEGDSRSWLQKKEGMRQFTTTNNLSVDEVVLRILEFIKRDGAPLH